MLETLAWLLLWAVLSAASFLIENFGQVVLGFAILWIAGVIDFRSRA